MVPALILFSVSFIIVGFGKSIGAILAGGVIAAIGFGSFQPSLYSMCILSETPLKRSVASNTLYMGIDLGLFLGPIVGSMIYQMYNYAIMFRTTSFIIFLSLIFFTLMLPSYHHRRRALEATEAESS